MFFKFAKKNMDVKHIIQESIDTKQAIINNQDLLDRIVSSSEICTNTLKKSGKILFCGNGGSAADAQHLAAELSGRFYYDRPPLNAEALHVNTSFLTAVGNDYSFDVVYSRMVEASGHKGDVLIAMSTSGNSTNILNAIDKAKSLGMIVIGFTGQEGGKMKNACDILLNVPSKDTPRIQESHIMIGHIICELIEKNIFPR